MATDRRNFLRRLGAASAAVGLTGCSADPDAPSDGASATTMSGAGAVGTTTDAGTPTASGSAPAEEPTAADSPGGTPTPEPTVSVERRPLMAGTADETPLVRIDAPDPGPTVLLVGGVHGDEVAGWKTATAATGWTVDAGSLVVIPRATARAVEARRREHPTAGDTNRHFPLDAPPESPLARALWRAVERTDPDYLLDLHSSRGIYGSGDGGVGQHAFRTPELVEETETAVTYLNREVLPTDRPAYEFSQGPLRGNYEMLVWKAHVELGVPAVLFEVTEKDLAVATQVAWTTAFLERLLAALDVRAMDR